MNIKQQFDQIFGQEHRAIAKITGDKGGSLSAVTDAGQVLTLIGQAQVGKKVYYDTLTRKILGDAPDLTVTDIVLS